MYLFEVGTKSLKGFALYLFEVGAKFFSPVLDTGANLGVNTGFNTGLEVGINLGVWKGLVGLGVGGGVGLGVGGGVGSGLVIIKGFSVWTEGLGVGTKVDLGGVKADDLGSK